MKELKFDLRVGHEYVCVYIGELLCYVWIRSDGSEDQNTSDRGD